MQPHHVFLVIGNAWLMLAMAISAFDGREIHAACSIVAGMVFLYYGDKVRRAAG